MENMNELEQISVVETKLEREEPFLVKAKCPACQSIKEISRPHQAIVLCPNRECITKSGTRRQFWILKHSFVDGKVVERRTNLEA